jgi:hypothetical protein
MYPTLFCRWRGREPTGYKFHDQICRRGYSGVLSGTGDSAADSVSVLMAAGADTHAATRPCAPSIVWLGMRVTPLLPGRPVGSQLQRTGHGSCRLPGSPKRDYAALVTIMSPERAEREH